MQCLGRKGSKENFNRCKIKNTEWYFPFCRHHKWQLFTLLFLTIPTYVVLVWDMSQIFAPSKNLPKDYTEVFTILNNYYTEQELARKKVMERIPQQYDSPTQTNPLYYSGLKKENENYKLITNMYEKGQFKSTEKLIIKEFGKRNWKNAKGINNIDKIKGFVVAAYFGNHEFDKAANLVLERDKILPKWNHSLKLDLIKCVRNYRIAKGLPAAISLIDSLKKDYDSEIISYFWTSTPFRTAYTIEKGTHESWDNEEIVGETKTDIEYLLDTYKNDPYCSYGFYLLGDSKEAINCNPKTRIIDILYYSIGIDLVNSLYKKYNQDPSRRKQLFYILKPISNNSDLEKIKEAISYFRVYIEQFKNSNYADDAAFWIGWLKMLTHDSKEAFLWFNKTNQLGNEAYFSNSLSYKSTHMDKFSEKLILSDLENNFISQQQLSSKRNQENDYFISSYHIEAFDKLQFKEKVNFMYHNPLNSQTLFLAYIKRTIGLNEYDKALDLIEELRKYPDKFLNQITPKIKNELIDLEEVVYKYSELINEEDVEVFISKILEIKNELVNRELALACLKKIKKKKKWIKRQDYLDYLIVKIFSDISRYKVAPEVEKFEKDHPQSEYLDDVLAELALVQLFKLKEPKNGIRTVKKIVNEHTNDNACDNALNWLGKYYFEECIEDAYWGRGNELTTCEQAIKVNKLIDDNYWFSTYKNISKYRLEKTQEIIQRYVPRNYSNPNSKEYREFIREFW